MINISDIFVNYYFVLIGKKKASDPKRCLNNCNGSRKTGRVNRRMAENGFVPPPHLGNFADISYLVEN